MVIPGACSCALIGCQPGPFDYELRDFPEAKALGVSESDDVTVDPALRPRVEDDPDTEAWFDPDAELLSTAEVSIERAVSLALRNNRGLRVEMLQPMITGTFEALERARFDPVLDGEVAILRERSQRISAATQEIFGTLDERLQGDVGIQQELPTGTTLDASFRQVFADSDRTPGQYSTRFGFTLTQALLRGADRDANVASIQQARLDTLASEYELRGFVESLVADVETTFWEFLLTNREIEIFESSLELAERQLNETSQRVEVGVVAETELAAAKAEIAQRREELINARSDMKRARLELLRLMNPRTREGWDLELQLLGEAAAEPIELDPVGEHVRLARFMRPELNEARLRLEQGRLDVVRTRNGLLPRLDFFITLGKTGFADSFGEAWADLDGRGYDLQAGLAFQYPLGNRAADAEFDRARFSRRQASESVENLTQLVDLEVRLAYIEVKRAEEQIEATRVTRELREETLRAESEKFRVGTSTTFLVAQAQRDLLESQIAEVRAMVNYRQTLIELYRLEGTLLQRRAIDAPGRRAVERGQTISG